MRSVDVARFPVRDAEGFQAFLRAQPRVIVDFHGLQCPYARRFLPAFEARLDRAPAPLVVRELDLDRDGEWDHHGIEVTPTLVVFERGVETARLEARRGVGLSPEQLDTWLERHR